MEEMLRFKNEVRQARKKWEKGKSNARIDSHKSNKRHKPEKHQPLPSRSRYERYTPLTKNRAIILKDCWTLKDNIKELI